MQSINDYNIADFNIRITYNEGQYDNTPLLHSFEPFRQEVCDQRELLFSLVVDDQLRPAKKELRERIRDVDTGNGHTIVDMIKGGGYQFIIKDLGGNSCCLLIANKDFSECHCALNGTTTMRTFGLNNALMLIFAFAGSKHDCVLIHASLVRHHGKGYAFTAKSGTGKSTQVSMWLRYIPECDLMNDDNPIIRIIGDEAFIYGSPWSGKTPCYRNIKAQLGAITQIMRSEKNYVVKNKPLDAFVILLPACSSMKWDEAIYDDICRIISRLIELVPNHTLYCRPDREAAIVCKETIAK